MSARGRPDTEPDTHADDARGRSNTMPDTHANARARPDTHADDGRAESRLERLDRNLDELNAELRVVITGVQVLFAFLLVVPFDSGFRGIGPYERTVYLVTLLLAAIAGVCTIAPSAEHRFLFRHDDKRHIVFHANRIVITGLLCLALAMCGALLLVATKLFGTTAGAIVAALAAVPFALLWFALPLARRARLRRGLSADPSDRDGRAAR